MEEGKQGTRGVIRGLLKKKDIVLGRTNPGLNAQGGFTPATGASPKCDNPRTGEYSTIALSDGEIPNQGIQRSHAQRRGGAHGTRTAPSVIVPGSGRAGERKGIPPGQYYLMQSDVKIDPRR
jgi:hypothetical protein